MSLRRIFVPSKPTRPQDKTLLTRIKSISLWIGLGSGALSLLENAVQYLLLPFVGQVAGFGPFFEAFEHLLILVFLTSLATLLYFALQEAYRAERWAAEQLHEQRTECAKHNAQLTKIEKSSEALLEFMTAIRDLHADLDNHQRNITSHQDGMPFDKKSFEELIQLKFTKLMNIARSAFEYISVGQISCCTKLIDLKDEKTPYDVIVNIARDERSFIARGFIDGINLKNVDNGIPANALISNEHFQRLHQAGREKFDVYRSVAEFRSKGFKAKMMARVEGELGQLPFESLLFTTIGSYQKAQALGQQDEKAKVYEVIGFFHIDSTEQNDFGALHIKYARAIASALQTVINRIIASNELLRRIER